MVGHFQFHLEKWKRAGHPRKPWINVPGTFLQGGEGDFLQSTKESGTQL